MSTVDPPIPIRRNVVYISGQQLTSECDKIPVVRKRASIVDGLIRAYNLHEYFSKIVNPIPATESNLALFHSSSYILYLKSKNTSNKSREGDVESSGESDDNDDDDADDDDGEEELNYGIGYDCPKLDNLWQFATTIAGATLQAADELLQWSADIVINWCGGWHHAQRDEAEGFCYVNDIGIGIQRLRQKFERILYIDLDVHHGNGVENGFAYSQRIFTLSFHQYEAGFYPGSGSLTDIGAGKGKGYSCNFPYRNGVKGELFCPYFDRVTKIILDTYRPDACVIQCGADVLAGDPLGGGNLLPSDLGKCVQTILDWNLPSIFLGGGGYNIPNTARYWTYLTAIICGKRELLADDIPDHKYFLRYGPGYELSVDSKRGIDPNTDEEFEANYRQICDNLVRFKVSAISAKDSK